MAEEQKTEQAPPEAKPEKKRKEKIVIAVGTRKRAVARAVLRQGKGRVKINSKPLELVEPEFVRMRIKEPLTIAGELPSQYDIEVNVRGGGVWGQADAARTAIANALLHADKNLRQTFIDYDRSMVISDSRRTEPHKPSRSTAGPRRKKQQSKR
jgi:small subunit ribosomal protein S9